MPDFIFKNFVMPAYHSLKHQNRIKYYQQLKKRDSLSREYLLEIQWTKLKALIEHCYENIPYYKKLFDQSDIHPVDIKDLNDYSKIPELKKQNIRDNYTELINPRLNQNQLCYSATGGSTGIPLKIYKSIEDREYGFALRYRSNEWCGWDLGDKAVWLVSDLRRLSESDGFNRKLGLWADRKLVLDTRNTNRLSMFKWVQQMINFNPKHIYGYSTLLGEFAKFIVENNIEIEGMKGVFSTAEPLRLRDTMNQAFNAPVFDQYGCSEIPCIAHECTKGNMHINIDEVLVEFIDVGKGSDIKKMVCTPLYIHGMPLLRYDLGDCASPLLKKCDCGLPYPVMEIKVSRVSDNLLSTNGRLVATSNFGWHLAHITKGVKQFQLIQENFTDFTFKIISTEEVRPENEKAVTDLLHGLLGVADLKIKFEYPETIANSDSGKFRPVISKIVESCNII